MIKRLTNKQQQQRRLLYNRVDSSQTTIWNFILLLHRLKLVANESPTVIKLYDGLCRSHGKPDLITEGLI